MMDAPASIVSLLASKPASQFIADLLTFQLSTGETLYFTNASRAITIGGIRYAPGPAKFARGRVSKSRGVSVDSHQIQVNEQNGPMIEQIFLGYFNLAIYTLSRVFAASANAAWQGPVTVFIGQIAQIDEIGLTYAKLTAKSALVLLDNDFPRVLIQASCPNVLYSPACGLNRADYLVSGAVAAGSTQNTVKTGLTEAAAYFTLGILSFTSGALKGISYLVKTHTADGTLYPAYPLLTAPAVGDAFEVSAGCDKTLATCETKFGLNAASGNPPYNRSFPWVPDPVLSY